MYKSLISYLDSNSIAYFRNYPTKELVSFKIGGNADIAVYPTSYGQIIEIIKELKKEKIKYVILGNGTNTYFSDDGFKGVIISTRLLNKITVNGEYLTAQCGADIIACAENACENGLSGLEFAYGIPGNVGGCVYMNASAFDKDMSYAVMKSTVYDSRADIVTEIKNDGHNYGMKHSVFMENKDLIILETAFKLKYAPISDIRRQMEYNMKRRLNSQPLDLSSAGSVFKRPQGNFASKLIDEAGLKGATIGGAMVSNKHAGFIVNTGSATASELNELIKFIKGKVYGLYGILLEEEIIYIE